MSHKADLKLDCLVHDLNNVFQTMIEAAELVGTDPNWEFVAQIILRSVEQGRATVASFAHREFRPAPLDEQVAQAVKFSQDCMALMHGPALKFEHDVPLGLQTSLAASALERVLVNLFLNAGQAARAAGHDTCRIRVTAQDRGDAVEINISDDGPGIAPDVLPAIFSPGFSTDQSRTGLGLHIVRSLVADAGGKVSASSGESGGAQFKIVLPAVNPVATAV